MKLALILMLITSNVIASAIPQSFIKSSESLRYMITPDDPTTSEVIKEEFDRAITEIYSLYVLEGVNQDRHLNLFMDWEYPYFSAWATHIKDNQYQINFWGGFARIPGMLIETFEFVVCHELGHILGKEPFHKNKHTPWASAEGQSDHFAVTKCLPNYYKRFNKAAFDSSTSMPFELAHCLDLYTEQDDQNICLKILKAARGFADVLKYLYPDAQLATFENFAPDTKTTVYDSYPSNQCRIDIFKNASTCINTECERNTCWFK